MLPMMRKPNPQNEQIKKEFENINLNMKCLENFINSNYRFRLLIYELLSNFVQKDEQSEKSII